MPSPVCAANTLQQHLVGLQVCSTSVRHVASTLPSASEPANFFPWRSLTDWSLRRSGIVSAANDGPFRIGCLGRQARTASGQYEPTWHGSMFQTCRNPRANTIAPRRPEPTGKASTQALAGCLYQRRRSVAAFSGVAGHARQGGDGRASKRDGRGGWDASWLCTPSSPARSDGLNRAMFTYRGRSIADMKLFSPVISQGPLYISTVGRRVV
jgi:hypothetical protein